VFPPAAHRRQALRRRIATSRRSRARGKTAMSLIAAFGLARPGSNEKPRDPSVKTGVRKSSNGGAKRLI
jgi:hypothetical protein